MNLKKVEFEELLIRLDDVEEKIFMIDMKDRWEEKDYKYFEELQRQKKKIENEIEKRYKNNGK